MCHDIQNDLLNAVSTPLLHMKKELHGSEGTFYAILADECKDISIKELVAVCSRYMYMGSVRKRAIGLVDTEEMTAEAIAKNIMEIVAPFELDLNLCVGFGFDGASVMAGHKGGVQAILRSTFQNAIYVHCHSHRLKCWHLSHEHPDRRPLELERGCDTRWSSRSTAVSTVFSL